MVTGYILVLAFSAWLVAYGLMRVLGRLARMLTLPVAPAGAVSLGVALMFLVVVGAPGWLVLLALLVAALLHRQLPIPVPLAWFVLLGALVPLIVAPLMGAPSWLALDAAMIAAAALGCLTPRGDLPDIRAAMPAYAILLLGLVAKAALGGTHVS